MSDPENVWLSAVGHSTDAKSIGFSPDGRIAASAGLNGIKIWTIAGGILPKVIDDGIPYRKVRFSQDGKKVAGLPLTAANNVRIWTVPALTLNVELDKLAHGSTLEFAPDGSLVIDSSVWDVERNRRSLQINTSTLDAAPTDIAISPDGSIVAGCAIGRKDIVLWDAESGSFLLKLTGHQDGVFAIAFSHDGRLLASGSSDKTVRLWDMSRNGRLVETFEGNTDAVVDVEFIPYSERVVSWSADEVVRFWDAGSTQPVHSVTDFPGGLSSGAISNDGSFLGAVVGGGRIMIVPNPTIPVRSGDFSMNSQAFAGGIRLWWEPSRGVRYQLQRKASIGADWGDWRPLFLQASTVEYFDNDRAFFRVLELE